MPSTARQSVDAQLNPLVVFDDFCDAYQSASSRREAITQTYQIAGYRVRLCFAGSALPPLLTPALAHLAIPNVDRPDLTICLWESETTGVRPPRCPWTPDQVDLRGEVPACSDERILTAVQTDVNAVSILDKERRLGVYWIDSTEFLYVYEQAAPLKVLLHWWLREQGLPMIHAGAVGTEGGAVLLVGKTGAGKSTTTLACLEAGLLYVSDDRCLLELGSAPQVHAIYNSAKLHPPQMDRFPSLAPAVRNPNRLDDEKVLVHVHEFAPQQVAPHLPVRAILLAKVAGRPETSLSPVSRIEVLRDFVTSTLVYQPGAAQAEVGMMTELVRQVPCYRINLGSDLSGIPGVITALLAEGGLN